MSNVGLVVDRYEKIELLNEKVKRCEACLARWEARSPVCADGNPYSKIVFMGRNPSKNDDERGIPFVDSSGICLEIMLKALGTKRADVFIMSLLLCYTKNNRQPRSKEVRACFPLVKAYLDIVKPKILVTFGAQAAKYMAGVTNITKNHGKIMKHKSLDCYVVTCIHPGAQMYRPYNKLIFAEDIGAVKEVIEELGIDV